MRSLFRLLLKYLNDLIGADIHVLQQMNPPDIGDLSDVSSSAAVTLTFVFQNEIYHENCFS